MPYVVLQWVQCSAKWQSDCKFPHSAGIEPMPTATLLLDLTTKQPLSHSFVYDVSKNGNYLSILAKFKQFFVCWIFNLDCPS